MTTTRRYDLLAPLSHGGQAGARLDGLTGFLHARVRPTRCGVLVYRHVDGTTTRELRHPEDVFDEASLESLKRIVVTRGHPRDGKGRPLDVTADNVAALQVGQLGDALEREELLGHDHIAAGLTVTKKDVVTSMVENRRDQCSVGYTADVVDEAGTYLGQPYDKRQRNIRYNHLAVDIDAGRGGATVNVLLDEADAVLVADDDPPPAARTDTVKITLRLDDNTTIELDAEVATPIRAALTARDARVKELETQLKAKSDEADKATAAADQAKTDLADAKKKADEAPAGPKLSELLDTLTAVRLVAPKLSAKKLADALDGKEPIPTLRKLAVLSACKDEAPKLEKKSDAYLEARFDALVEAAKDREDDDEEDDDDEVRADDDDEDDEDEAPRKPAKRGKKGRKSDAVDALGAFLVGARGDDADDDGERPRRRAAPVRSRSGKIDEEDVKRLDDHFKLEDPLAKANPKWVRHVEAKA
jgi:hypothetical protein